MAEFIFRIQGFCDMVESKEKVEQTGYGEDERRQKARTLNTRNPDMMNI